MFEHLSAEEHRLELERTREELLAVKKLLTDRDTELLQLKTAHRKLQDVLRKKDKDLQNVFAVLRAPQDAELTKKRKTELVERLLTETQQRVVNAEAVAEERKRELDKLKYSSKFLRYQELEIEIDECYAEIERLRTELSQFVVVGKLKISRRRVGEAPTNDNAKTPSKRLVGRLHHHQQQQQQSSTSAKSTNQHHSESAVASRERSSTTTAQDIKPLTASSSANATTRQGFVDKTRRRAVEAEYNKQLRLAELEAECELEENLRIRAKREAQAQAEARRLMYSQQQQNALRIRENEPIKKTTEVTASADGIKATAPAIAPTHSADSASTVQENNHGSASSTDPATEPVGETDAIKQLETKDTESAAIVIQSAWRAQRLKDATATDLGDVAATVAVVEDDREATAKDVTAVAETPLPTELPAVAESRPSLAQQSTTQYEEEDDFDHDDLPKEEKEETEDPDGESLVEEEEDDAMFSRAEIAKPVEVHHRGEEEDEEVVDEDVTSDKTPQVKTAAVVPVPATQEETYETEEEEEEEEEEEAQPKREEEDKPNAVVEGHNPQAAHGAVDDDVSVPRQGFLVSVDATGDDGDLTYQPPHQTYTQGFVVDPTYASQVFVPDLQVGELVVLVADQVTSDEENHSHDEPSGGAVEETGTPVALESTLPTGSTPTSPQEPWVVAVDTPSPRDALFEDPTATTTDKKEEQMATHETVEPLPVSGAKESITIAAAAEEKITTMTPVSGEAQEHADVAPVAIADDNPTDKEVTSASPRLHDDDRPEIPTAEADLDAVVSTSEEPQNTEVEQALHACDVAMDAATDTIQRQIQSALAADLAVSESESTPPPHDQALTSSASGELTESELAAAMDSAARKIQRFWRDMEAKYSTTKAPLQPEVVAAADSTPAPPEVVVAVDDVTSNEASGVATPLAVESAESSPPVSEAETDW